MKWIKCEDKLPEYGERVICCDKDGTVFIACRFVALAGSEEWCWSIEGYDTFYDDPIAWMPLPVPMGQKIKPKRLDNIYPSNQYVCGNCRSAVTDCVEFSRGAFGAGVKVVGKKACPNCGADVDWSDEK